MKKASRPHFQQDVCVSDWSYSLSQTSEDEKLMPVSRRAMFRGLKPNLLIRGKVVENKCPVPQYILFVPSRIPEGKQRPEPILGFVLAV